MGAVRPGMREEERCELGVQGRLGGWVRPGGWMPLGPRPSASSGQLSAGMTLCCWVPAGDAGMTVALRVVSAVGDGVGFPAGDGGVTG